MRKNFSSIKAFVSKIIDQGISQSKIFYLPNTTENFYKPLSVNKKELPLGLKLCLQEI